MKDEQLRFITQEDADKAWANGFGWGNAVGSLVGAVVMLVLLYVVGSYL